MPKRQPSLPLAAKQLPEVSRARRKTAAEKARRRRAQEARQSEGIQGTAHTYQGARDLAGIRDMPPGLKAAHAARRRPVAAPPATGRITVINGATGQRHDLDTVTPPKPRARKRRPWCSICSHYGKCRHNP